MTGKGQFLFQSQSKAKPKNAQITAQLHSSHTLVMLKFLQASLQQYVNSEVPDVQAGFWKGPDAGKDWGQEKKGMTEEEMVGWHHLLMDMSQGKLQELVIDREA